MIIGVLALQGAFREHIDLLKQLNVTGVEVRLKKDFDGIQGLIIPGGESTTMAIVSDKYSISETLKDWIRQEKPTFGTCAGMILLAKQLIGKKLPDQVTLNALDVEVHRNFFGSQLGSFVSKINTTFEAGAELKGVFIRAPVVSKVLSDEVKILATLNDTKTVHGSSEGQEFSKAIVAVQQKNLLAISFHPELIGDTTWHSYFIKMIQEAQNVTS